MIIELFVYLEQNKRQISVSVINASTGYIHGTNITRLEKNESTMDKTKLKYHTY